jgi:hypothetical protein
MKTKTVRQAVRFQKFKWLSRPKNACWRPTVDQRKYLNEVCGIKVAKDEQLFVQVHIIEKQ